MNIDDFLRIESKYGLNEVTCDGIHYWNYCRFVIWNEMIVAKQLDLGEAHVVKSNNFFNKINKLRKLKSTRDLKNKDYLILNHPRRVANDNKYECIYTDELAKRLGSYVFWEEYNNMNHMIPTVSNQIIYTDAIEMMCAYYLTYKNKFCKKEFVELRKKLSNQLEAPLSELSRIYDWDCDFEQIYRLLVVTIWKIAYLKPRYERIFEKINPKEVIEVVGYSNNHMLICEIAKEKGVPVVELQHGTTDALHSGYHYGDIREIKQFADYFLAYSDYWKKQVKLPISDEKIVPVGFPYFENRVSRMLERKSDDANAIVFLSQGAYGKHLSKLAVDVANDERFGGVKILYKLHPGEFYNWQERYQILQSSRVEVVGKDSMGLYDCFLASRLQIGCTSTAIYEGLGFGLKTLICSTNNKQSMEQLVNDAYAKYAYNVDDVWNEYIKTDNFNVSDVFWAKNSMENMLHVIEGIKL